MEELLKVFHVLVDMISSSVHLQEACFSSHFWPFSSHFRSFSASFGLFSGDDGPFLACSKLGVRPLGHQPHHPIRVDRLREVQAGDVGGPTVAAARRKNLRSIKMCLEAFKGI